MSNENIITLMNEIKDEKIVLPAIQRDFVWNQEQITDLLDSIMRGYPIGIALLWCTYEDIRYRPFDLNYKEGTKSHTFDDSAGNKLLKVVLDGQQRLQSLYVALYGSYTTKDAKKQTLYFNVFSGGKEKETENSSQQLYEFKFASAADVKKWNKQAKEKFQTLEDQYFEEPALEYYISVTNILKADKRGLRNNILNDLGLQMRGEEDGRIEDNLAQFDKVFTYNPNILKTLNIDDGLPPSSKDRKKESDVLEIFVRINRQGTSLSKSDLIFSILKLRWKESSDDLPALVEKINKENSFNLDSDFVIRCLFAVSDFGTKFNLDLLRDQKRADLIRDNFKKCAEAIASTVDFVKDECWCQSSDVIGGSSTLIPFVYYLFHQKRSEIPVDKVEEFRKILYLLGFTRAFSRYADGRLGPFIREDMKSSDKRLGVELSFKSLVRWVRYWDKIDYSYGEPLLQGNVKLVLNFLQRRTGGKALNPMNAPEIDHIFPQSLLKEKNVEPAKINHFANFWLLAKGKNINKSNIPPAEYFKDVLRVDLNNALIDPSKLGSSKFTKRTYLEFLEDRSKKILQEITKKIGLSAADFPTDDED